jgi:hypothetical protein
MTNAKRVNALLWTGNVVLIIGIVAFAFQFLIFPEARPRQVDPPETVPPQGKVDDPTDVTPLSRLPNPVIPRINTPPPGQHGQVRLIGTDRIKGEPESDTAYMEVVSRKLHVNAYVGETILDGPSGQEVGELSGWRLKNVTSKTAVFTTPAGEQTLQLDETTISSAPGPGNPLIPGNLAMAGQPWESGKFTSKKDTNRSNELQEIWTIDRKEVDWAAANVESILQGVTMEPFAGGGLKITSLPVGSFGEERGLRTGDVLRSVNGQQIESPAKLNEVFRNLSKNTQALNIVVDRAGKMYTLSYSIPRTR